MICAVFDTKPYDREFLGEAARDSGLELRFLEFRLGLETAFSADGAESVCV
ncbi:MAG: 2-hydroxyacid dehydrogenase, partial [Verrucomicrobiaceae bacterium]